ncbi:MAG: hypothetical protein HPY74_20855 [Firmicutes bacterium]|nr:hypothetical protein [Bacillota bacterium]NSW93057.1 hypothetical protein [Bacillota bacterium]
MLFLEAIEAYTQGNKRIIGNIQLVELFGEDNNRALRRYVQLHKSHPEKEYYVVHTSYIAEERNACYNVIT